MFTLAISLLDFITLTLARFKRPVRVQPNTLANSDFTILIPIFGDMSYLKNVSFLRPYGRHVVLCTTNKESPAFNAGIQRIASENGFRVFRSEVARHTQKSKPNPWRLFTSTLHGGTQRTSDAARDEIIRDSFAIVDTTYCIFLDADTTTTGNLYHLVGLMQARDYDVASVRVLVARPRTIMERLQAIEYRFAMEARKLYPWLTSGACMVTKTDAIKEIMSHHSLFFSGGDIEVGKLARMLKMKVGHLSFNFFTVAPDTFKAWFKQRMAWFGGGFRHAVVNAGTYTWRHPFYFFYFTVIVFAFSVLRWIELFRHPELVPLVIVLYWVLLFGFRWEDRSWLFFLFPFYALIQVMVLVLLGPLRYLHMAWHSRNVGIIKLRPPEPQPAHVPQFKERPQPSPRRRLVLAR